MQAGAGPDDVCPWSASAYESDDDSSGPDLSKRGVLLRGLWHPQTDQGHVAEALQDLAQVARVVLNTHAHTRTHTHTHTHTHTTPHTPAPGAGASENGGDAA